MFPWLSARDNVAFPLKLRGVPAKERVVRADALPLVFKALGCESFERGAHVKVRVTGIDEMTLDLHANLIERLDGRIEAAAEEEDEEETTSGPLTLAIDVNEVPAEAPAAE